MPPREAGREYRDVRIKQAAEAILHKVGLSLRDLEKFKQPGLVVDLGCGEGDVGRAAKLQGFDSVISIADKQLSDTTDLDFRLMNAHQEIALPENSVGLLISRNGPHLWTYNEEQAKQLFENINRVLNEKGEARFHVPWLGYIQMQIAEQMSKIAGSEKSQGVWRKLKAHPTDWQAASGGLRQATEAKISAAKPYLIEAMQRSTKLVQKFGYDVSLKQKTGTSSEQDLLWIMKKSKEK